MAEPRTEDTPRPADADVGQDVDPQPDPAIDREAGRTAGQEAGQGAGHDTEQPAERPAELDATRADAPGGSLDPESTRVLIAEDEALIRLDLKEMLEEEGFDVVAEVADGASAVRLTRELRPDLAILDIKMPVMDGIQAAEEIARDRLAAVLILTAFSQRDLVEKARRAGAMAYLVKPFQKHDLLPAVEIAAGRFREMSGLESTVDDLQGRLEARKVVEQAKGLLQEHEGMSESEAFRWIQQQAMSRRETMREVADKVLDEFGDGG